MTMRRFDDGPVISTRRLDRSAGAGGTRQSPSRMLRVSTRKSGVAPASISACRRALACNRRRRVVSKLRCNSATNPRASSLTTSAYAAGTGPIIWTLCSSGIFGVSDFGSVEELDVRARDYQDAVRVGNTGMSAVGGEVASRIQPARRPSVARCCPASALRDKPIPTPSRYLRCSSRSWYSTGRMPWLRWRATSASVP